MDKAKISKINAINNRISHNNRCDLRKYNSEGDKKRCTNCTDFFDLNELNNSGRCKPCWALEAKHRRNLTIEEYKTEIKDKWDKIEKEYIFNGVKKCNTCLNIKPFKEFYKETKSWDGLQNKCKDCAFEYNNQYNPYSKDYNIKKSKSYYDFRRKNDIQFKMALNLRNLLNSKIKQYNLKKQTSALNLVGIPIKEFISYIENKWVDGYMNWENWGGIWELDHITPISSYDLTDPKQLKECFHYTNYQPLFKFTTVINGVEYLGNRNKSNKII
jgi:hypothetical protein